MKDKKNKKNRILNIFKEALLIIWIIFITVVVALSCGLALIVFDSVRQDDKIDEYSDQILMEKWKEIEIQKIKKQKKVK